MAKKKRKASGSTRKQNLAGVSLNDLQAEVARRATQVGSLVAERDELSERVEELDEQIRMLSSISGASAPARRGRPPKAKRGRPVGSVNRKAAPGRKSTGRKRPHNSASLAESMAKMLKGKTMGVTDIAANVQKAGYKTNSENFRTIVNQTLIKDGRFKKVSRGQYTAA